MRSMTDQPSATPALLARPVDAAELGRKAGAEQAAKAAELAELGGSGGSGGAASSSIGRIGVLIVTWNRKQHVASVLRAVAAQTYSASRLDVVVIDNAGTDATLEHLVREFNPERVVDNPTARAHEPNFQPDRARANDLPNTLGLAGLTIVRNTENMGGCGGFNTGFAFIERIAAVRPECVWLVDDDADVHPTTLEHLMRVMRSDDHVGLVGSRTVDIRDRLRTIETTIYYDRTRGVMMDDAPEGHDQAAQHRQMVERFGGTRGAASFSGEMDVDVVSACCMLARWDAVVGARDASDTREPVGFWDARYFIYCDDADWCLRFKKHGWRVVLSLDAVVYHTPWLLKLTPARIYYANRNRVWMAQKALPPERLRPVTRRTLLSFLKDALRANLLRRTFHSQIILSTARDVVIGREGKTGSDGPPAEPVESALERAGALRPGARIAVLCCQSESLKWFAELKQHVERAKTGSLHGVEWLALVRNDVPGQLPPGAMVYGGTLKSRLKKQFTLLRTRPTACVVFEQTNDLPILAPFGPAWNVHIDLKTPTMAQLERDGWLVRAGFLAGWCVELVRCLWYAQFVRPFVRQGKYG